MFLETICILRGEVQNLQGHKARMQRTASHFGFKAPQLPDLPALIQREIQDNPEKRGDSRIKCRIIYHKIIREVSFESYLPKKIASLKLIEASVDYSFKLTDRRLLNALLAQKGDCDEILITRNGIITDTSYSNVVFSQGEQYFTPESPLLNGTKRQKLLNEGIITEKRIDRNSLSEYDHIYLINAMLDIEDGVSLPVRNVTY